MQIKEIKIADLPDFVQSELWQQLHPKPITPLRAISQFMNPGASPEDVALVIAHKDQKLIGLAGILPSLVNGQKGRKASSNTCWWVDGAEGSKIAFPLLMRAFVLSAQRMFMTDCTPHTLNILKKTNWFAFPDLEPGLRGFLKFDLHRMLPSKFPFTKKFVPIIKLSDQALNLIFSPLGRFNRARFGMGDVKVEQLAILNSEMHAFIEQHSQDEFIRRTGKDMEWIVRYPWIQTGNTDISTATIEYPFSHIVQQFEQYFLQISVSGKNIGLLMISLRDGNMKVPYAWFEEKEVNLILKVIYRQAMLKNAFSLTLFLPALVKSMHSATHPFLFRKKIKRLVAISKQLENLYHQYPKLQDGDGDIVFT